MHSAGGLVSAGNRARLPDPAAGIRPRRRRPRHRIFRRRSRATPTSSRFDMGGTTAKACLIEDGRAEIAADDGSGARAPVQERLRPADQGAGHRHDRDRRRRRLHRRDRRGRPAARRPAFRRRRSRPRLLRPWRHRAHRDRRQLCSATTIPASSSAAAWRWIAARPNARSAGVGARLGLSAIETAPGASTAWSSRAWPPPRASTSSKRAGTRARYAMVGFGGAGPAHAARGRARRSAWAR